MTTATATDRAAIRAAIDHLATVAATVSRHLDQGEPLKDCWDRAYDLQPAIDAIDGAFRREVYGKKT